MQKLVTIMLIIQENWKHVAELAYNNKIVAAIYTNFFY